MKVEKYRLEDLHPAEKNIRMHPEAQIREYKRSLQKFKQVKPITIDEKNVILTGNGMYMAMRELGWTEAYCNKITGLSEKDKKKLMMADNRIFNLGVDNISVFDEILAELSDDLDIPGYDEDFLKSLLMDDSDMTEKLSEYGTIDPQEAEDIKNANVPYEAPEQPTGETTPTASYASERGSEGREESSRQYVICPKCGEKIWL